MVCGEEARSTPEDELVFEDEDGPVVVTLKLS